MRERRFFWRLHLFFLSSYFFSFVSLCRRLPAVTSGEDNGKTVTHPITDLSGYLYIPYDCLWIPWVDQSENNPFPLFILIMTDKIRRQMQEIALGIQDVAINLPKDLCEEVIQETRFSLIVKQVNPRKQNLRAMLSTLPRLWGGGQR